MRTRLERFLPTLRIGHAVFVIALLVRLSAVARVSMSVLFLASGGDMRFYSEWAQRVARGQLADGGAFFGLPLYPWIVGALYKLFGANPYVPLVLQAAVDAGTCVIIYQLACTIFRDASRLSQRLVGLGAAIGWLFFIPAQAYAVVLMPTSLATFIFWLVVWRLVRTDRAFGMLAALGYGAVIGFAATAVANLLFLVPLAAARLLTLRSKLAAFLLLVLGVALGTAPCWFHNYFVAREPVLLSAHSGINFWLGNNPEAKGYLTFPAGMRADQHSMLEDSTAIAESAVGYRLDRAQVSAYWSARARAFIILQPLAWLRLMWRKFANFWNAFQYDDLGIIDTLREQHVVWPGLRFGLVAALGFAGSIFAIRAHPMSRWVAAAILLHMIAVLTVFVTERYRIAIVPGLLLLAAFGLCNFARAIVQTNWRRIAAYVVLLFAATLAVATPRREPALWALDYYNAGRYALEAGDLDLAERRLQLARAYVPENAETNFALGNLHLARGDMNAARSSYLTALRVMPQHRHALTNLGLLELNAGNYDRAGELLRAAAAVAPNDAKPHYLLAQTELKRGQIAAAAQELARAKSIQPDAPEIAELEAQIKQRQ